MISKCLYITHNAYYRKKQKIKRNREMLQLEIATSGAGKMAQKRILAGAGCGGARF